MRRTFLFQMLAGIFTAAAAKPRPNQTDADGIAGDWHLLAASDDEAPPPPHRMNLRFRNVSGNWQGAILSQRDRSEIPLAICSFDGSTLRFQMAAPQGKAQSEMPVMLMTRAGARFEGVWTNGLGEKMGPGLKLVRAAR